MTATTKTATAVTGGPARGHEEAATVTVEDRARIAVIGAAGEMGALHLSRLTERDDVTIVALADPAEAARQRAEALSARHFPTIDALTTAARDGSIKLDGVVVAVPNALHEEAAAPFLRMGVPVFCEKPVAHTLASASRMLAAAREGGTHLTIGYHLPHHPAVAPWIAEARETMGELRSADVWAVRRDGVPGRSAFLNALLTGGGPGVDLLGHVLAVLAAVIGPFEIIAVVGTTHPRQRAGTPIAEDWVAGAVTLRPRGAAVTATVPREVVDGSPARVVDGAVVTVEAAWRRTTVEGDADQSWGVELHGSRRSMRIELPYDAEGLPAYGPQMDAWIARVRGLAPWDGDGLDGAWRAQEIVTALYQSSAEGGRAVAVESAPALVGEVDA